MLVGKEALEYSSRNILNNQRYPFSPYPEGWYAVAMAADIPVKGVEATRVCGEEVVVYRAQSGEINVVNAFCPHLGAHLGFGGIVQGESIRCPFHGWRFDCSGSCDDVPEMQKPIKVKIGTFPSKIVNGMVMVWWSPERDKKRQPSWDIEPVDLTGWTEPVLHEECIWILNTHVQEIAENGVDIAHFSVVHGANKVGEIGSVEYDGAVATWQSISQISTQTGDVDSVTRVRLFGLGLQQVHALSANKFPSARTFLHSTPIDEHSICIRLAVSIQKTGKENRDSQMLSFLIPKLAAELAKDFDIWERKKYLVNPPISRVDGPIRQFRKWATQFYIESPTSD
ncbi:Rieske 2Fe-2S domain-containing protein [Pseudoalteromonas galatheae]|uniref:Rieske 2Fe-2S domain-containing protein n=1 Tax=Pseudoalteromonas galatheae TaxID=579562 RepID=UPI0030D1ECF8